MILALVLNRLRECGRRPFPYVAAVGVLLLALASRAMIGFSFGAEEQATANLVISAVFLTGLLHAGFVATASVNRDLERGTLGFLLAKPVTLGSYIASTFLGLVACSTILCAVLGLAVALLFHLTGAPTGDWAAVATGSLRALVLVAVLEAGALLASCLLQRVAAPLALVAFFVLASLSVGPLLPSFELFGLDASSTVSAPLLGLYALLWCAILLLVAYIVLSFRATLRTNT